MIKVLRMNYKHVEPSNEKEKKTSDKRNKWQCTARTQTKIWGSRLIPACLRPVAPFCPQPVGVEVFCTYKGGIISNKWYSNIFIKKKAKPFASISMCVTVQACPEFTFADLLCLFYTFILHCVLFFLKLQIHTCYTVDYKWENDLRTPKWGYMLP